MVFVARDEAAVVLEPGEQAFYFPAAPVAAKRPTILGHRCTAVAAVGRDHLQAPTLGEACIKSVAVVGLVSDQSHRDFRDEPGFERCLGEGDLMRRSACNPGGERKTSAVCNNHDLGPFSALCFTHARAPFFALAKEPSIKASSNSSPPLSRRSSARALSTPSSVPSRAQAWKRRWHVAREGYLSGRSCHGAPVRNTHRIPSITHRSDCLGRPFPSSRRETSGNKPLIRSHWLSVRSLKPHYITTLGF